MIIFVLKQVVTCCLPDLLIAEALQSTAKPGQTQLNLTAGPHSAKFHTKNHTSKDGLKYNHRVSDFAALIYS